MTKKKILNASERAKKGAIGRAESLTAKRRSEIARRAAETRWNRVKEKAEEKTQEERES